MPQSRSPIATLHQLAQKDLDKATTQLGEVRQAQLQAENQLHQLIHYQDEYRQSLNDTLSDGITNTRWTNYHHFIATLEKAIEQHREQLASWNERLDKANDYWRQKQQRLYAWETLQSRSLAETLLRENRLEQKRTDEFAQRSTLRKAK